MHLKPVIVALVVLVALSALATPAAASQHQEDDCIDNDCVEEPGPGNGAPPGVPPDSGVTFPDSTFDAHFPDSTFDTHFPDSTFDGKEHFPDSTFSGQNPVFESPGDRDD